MRAILSTQDTEYQRAIKMLNGESSEWAYDTETTGLNTRKDDIIGFGISNCFKGFYFCHKYYEDGELHDGLSKEECLVILNLLVDKKLIMWNGSFDTRFTLNYFGVNLIDSLHIEGMLAKHTVDEEIPFRLKDVGVKIYGDQEKKPQADLNESIKARGGKPGADIYMGDTDLVAKYCIQDCLLTYRLSHYYLGKIKEENLEKFFFEDEVMPLYKYVTIPMEKEGIPVDTKQLIFEQGQISVDIALLEEKIQTLILPLLESSFVPWYLEKYYPPKRTGSFAQALCKYANLSLPKTGSGAFSLARKALESLPSSIYKDYLLGAESISDDTIRKIQLAETGGVKFNLKSKHHLKKLFFETLGEKPISKTKKGNPQVNDDFLNKMAEKHDWVSLLRDFNKLNKLKSTYIDGILENQEDGIFYPSWKQFGTTSGRYSGNVQQLPRPKEESQGSEIVLNYNNKIRKFFIAGENHVFIDSDYESLEPHILAHISGDEGLKDIFRSGCDFYSTVAIATEKLDGVSAFKKDTNYLGRVNKLLRQKAKEYSLGVPYGLESYGLSKILKVSLEEADGLRNKYLEAYPKLKEWMEDTYYKLITTGILKSEVGRTRHQTHIPELYQENKTNLEVWQIFDKYSGDIRTEKFSNRRKFRNSVNNSKNFQIQSLAATITNRACIAINKELVQEGIDGYVCAQIHDQIVVRVPKDMAEKWRKRVQYLMENTYKLSIPLKAPAEIAKDFNEGH